MGEMVGWGQGMPVGIVPTCLIGTGALYGKWGNEEMGMWKWRRWGKRHGFMVDVFFVMGPAAAFEFREHPTPG